MKLNVDKCKLMCIGRQNPTSSSTLLHFKLTGTTQGKGPGVIVSSSMKTSVTSAAVGSKANTALPEQGTLQIVIGVMVMWQGTGTASFHGSREGTGIQEPLIPSRIEDIAPQAALNIKGGEPRAPAVGVGFLGRVMDKPPQHCTQSPRLCTWAKSSWTLWEDPFLLAQSPRKSWGGLAVNVLVAGASCSGWKVFNPSVFNPLCLTQRGLIPW